MEEKDETVTQTIQERTKKQFKHGIALLFAIAIFIFLIGLFYLFFSKVSEIFSRLKYFYDESIPTLIFASELIILLIVSLILVFKLIIKFLSDEE
jgi:Na+/melibiose symporter-like transporter